MHGQRLPWLWAYLVASVCVVVACAKAPDAGDEAALHSDAPAHAETPARSDGPPRADASPRADGSSQADASPRADTSGAAAVEPAPDDAPSIRDHAAAADGATADVAANRAPADASEQAASHPATKHQAGDDAPAQHAPAQDSPAQDSPAQDASAKRPRAQPANIDANVVDSATVANAGDAIDVRALYAKRCKTCHGADGKADTEMGKKHDIPDLTKAAWKRQWPKAKIVDIITHGKADTKMKAFATKLSKQEIDALAEHVIAL